ncbi:hypothetical protein [Roseivirga sp. E12]|uniref:hypothetical protein n=1 Tax=Roseivirga sp. E12 TaxID=2819237 RepID=UPI001ABC2E82|nr:hypothetical protein [Roseivirga sp. E12]MBO3697246.1 hypothetical protein [Roseivirga sp. E12]
MEIKDLKPAWEHFKVQSSIMGAQMYDAQSILQLLDASEPKSASQRIIGAGVMLALILLFCQGG